jgi:hypothetical protein
MSYTVVYCVSDKGNMIPLLEKSLKSLSQFIDKERIQVCFTPPHKDSYPNLEALANLVYRENTTEPFKVNENAQGRYAEKFQFTKVETPKCIYLDHDTIINRDISELLADPYDVAFRAAGTFHRYYDLTKWYHYFILKGKTPIPMPNSGLILFQNYNHQKIEPALYKALIDPDMVEGYSGWQNRDQIALALACSELKIKWLTADEHCYRWRNEVPLRHKPYVTHGEFNPKIIKENIIITLRSIAQVVT